MGTWAWHAGFMGVFTGLLVALGVGLPLLLAAVWLDARRRRRLEGPPPEDSADGSPRYLTQSQVADLPRPGSGERPALQPEGSQIDDGYAHPDFATAGNRAEYTDAYVLVVDGTITSIRQLMTPLARYRPLILVATGFAPEVLDTLSANRRALALPVLAVATSRLNEVLTVTGGAVVPLTDLMAGYVPEDALGRAGSWVSDVSTSWIHGCAP